MQLSNFETLVLSSMIEGDEEQQTLAEQLASATVEKRDYTGVGLYTKLVVDPKSPRLKQPGRRFEEIPRAHFSHPALPAGAGAMLWLAEGRMDTLECFTYEGDWPGDEGPFSISTYRDNPIPQRPLS